MCLSVEHELHISSESKLFLPNCQNWEFGKIPTVSQGVFQLVSFNHKTLGSHFCHMGES